MSQYKVRIMLFYLSKKNFIVVKNLRRNVGLKCRMTSLNSTSTSTTAHVRPHCKTTGLPYLVGSLHMLLEISFMTHARISRNT